MDLGDGNPIGSPLAHGRLADAEMFGDARRASLLCVKPFIESHASSLVTRKRLVKHSLNPKSIACVASMHPADAKRRERFVAYVKRRFGDAVTRPRSDERRALQKKLRYSKGSMTQIFDARQPFGQRRGSQLAARLGLDPEHFERDLQPGGAHVTIGGIDDVNSVTKSSKHSIPREWVTVYQLLRPESREWLLALAKMRLRDQGIDLDRLFYTQDERAMNQSHREGPDVTNTKPEEESGVQEEQQLQGMPRGKHLRKADDGTNDHQGAGRRKGTGKPGGPQAK